jgi:hypothetical protein
LAEEFCAVNAKGPLVKWRADELFSHQILISFTQIGTTLWYCLQILQVKNSKRCQLQGKKGPCNSHKLNRITCVVSQKICMRSWDTIQHYFSERQTK